MSLNIKRTGASSILVGPFKHLIESENFEISGIEEMDEKGLFKLPKPTDPKIIDARRTLDNMEINLKPDPSLVSANLDLEYNVELMYNDVEIYECKPFYIRLSGTLTIEMMDVNSTDPDDRESYDVEVDLDLQKAQFEEGYPWDLSYSEGENSSISHVPIVEIKSDGTIYIDLSDFYAIDRVSGY